MRMARSAASVRGQPGQVVAGQAGHDVHAEVQLRVDLVQGRAHLAHEGHVLVGEVLRHRLHVQVDAVEAALLHELGDAGGQLAASRLGGQQGARALQQSSDQPKRWMTSTTRTPSAWSCSLRSSEGVAAERRPALRHVAGGLGADEPAVRRGFHAVEGHHRQEVRVEGLGRVVEEPVGQEPDHLAGDGQRRARGLGLGLGVTGTTGDGLGLALGAATLGARRRRDAGVRVGLLRHGDAGRDQERDQRDRQRAGARAPPSGRGDRVPGRGGSSARRAPIHDSDTLPRLTPRPGAPNRAGAAS